MSEKSTSTKAYSKHGFYEIRLLGHLDDRWVNWFEGLTIKLEDCGETQIFGPVIDQAALHGLIKKVRDLNMPLLSVNRVNFEHRSKKTDQYHINQE